MLTKSTIVLKLGGLGDLLMVTPAIRAYKKSFPKTKLNFIVGKSNQQVLKGNPYIDCLYTVDDFKIFRGGLNEKISETLKLMNIIKNISPDTIFILHRDWRWNFVSFLSGVKERYGFKRDLRGLFLTKAVKTSEKEHEIKKYFKVFGMQNGFKEDGLKMDIFPSNQDEDDLLKLTGNFLKNKVIAVSPGGASNAKEEMDIRRWPIEYYLQLVKKIIEKTDYSILLIGGKNDVQFTRKLRIDKRRIIDLAGKTNIQQTYLALRKCKALVTHDSGPMHIGAAAGIPVISLFGPTHPLEKYPITNPKSVFIWKVESVPCAPCYRDGKFPKCKSKECMYEISVDEVFDKLQETLK